MSARISLRFLTIVLLFCALACSCGAEQQHAQELLSKTELSWDSPGRPPVSIKMTTLADTPENAEDIRAIRAQTATATLGCRAIRKNVLILGRSKAGKTSMITHLINPEAIASTEANLVYETKEPTAYSISYRLGDLDYNVNIIDTPGFFEEAGKLQASRTEIQISRLIVRCLLQEITRIDRIYIAMSLDNYIGAEDKKSVELDSDLFRGARNSIRFIITKSQDHSKAKLARFVEQLKAIDFPDSVDTSSALFHGMLVDSLFEEQFHEVVKKYAPRVKDMREEVIQDMTRNSTSSVMLDSILYQDKRIELLSHLFRFNNMLSPSPDPSQSGRPSQPVSDAVTNAIASKVIGLCTKELPQECSELIAECCDIPYACSLLMPLSGQQCPCNGTTPASSKYHLVKPADDRPNLEIAEPEDGREL